MTVRARRTPSDLTPAARLPSIDPESRMPAVWRQETLITMLLESPLRTYDGRRGIAPSRKENE